MSCGIQIIKIPFKCEYIVQGDTIPKTILRQVNGSIDFTTTEFTLQVKKGNTNFIDYSNGNGITVIDSDTLEIDEVPYTENNYPVGSYIGDFRYKEVDDFKKTLFRANYVIIEKK